MDIHAFHGKIIPSPPPSSETRAIALKIDISMQKQEPRRILAVVTDLFFSVKLTEAAKRAGLSLEFVKDSNEILEKAKSLPSLIIFDLNFEAVNPVKLIAKLKGKLGDEGNQPDRLSLAHSGGLEAAGAGSRVRHGPGPVGLLAEYAADFQAPLGVVRPADLRLARRARRITAAVRSHRGVQASSFTITL